MLNNPGEENISIEVDFVEEDIFEPKEGLKSKFSNHSFGQKIDIEYKYLGEPNYDRVQLELSILIDGINIISDLGIDKHIELPYQYPGAFELIDSYGNIMSIPHNQGFYLVNLKDKTKTLIKYLSSKFTRSYFYDNLFIIIEDKGFTLYNIDKKTSQIITLGDSIRRFILCIQLTKDKIFLILHNADLERKQLLVYDLNNLQNDNYKTYNLCDYIKDEELLSKLKYEHNTKLEFIPEFKYNSIIDSWWTGQTKKKNALIGRIEKRFEPIKVDNKNFIRKELYDYVELRIKTFANTRL